MRRSLLISLTLVLALAGWGMVCAEDFYVVPVLKGKYAPVPKTGQTALTAPGDDGHVQKGVAWPTPRFTDNGNGTVTDKLTELIWLKNGNCFGQKTWAGALSAAATVADGTCGLTDGSKAGDWRLPHLRELQSLIDYGRQAFALPADPPFTEVQWSSYWSSTTFASSTTHAWLVYFGEGGVYYSDMSNPFSVWCVRGGQ